MNQRYHSVLKGNSAYANEIWLKYFEDDLFVFVIILINAMDDYNYDII